MINDDMDDFPSSPLGSGDALELYNAFLQAIDLAKTLPKKELGADEHATIHQIMHEVNHAQRGSALLYRKNTDTNEALIRLWLSRVRKSAQLFSALTDIKPFKGITLDDLSQLAAMSADVSKISNVREALLNLGIVLIFERPIPGIKLDGAVFTMQNGSPVVAMSLRYSRIDSFWFTLMHELSHIVLHYDKLATAIVDDLDEDRGGIIELEADRLARDSLISRSAWRSSSVQFSMKETAIKAFAQEIGVHPAIVAGRLRRETKRYDIFSEMVNEFDVRKALL